MPPRVHRHGERTDAPGKPERVEASGSAGTPLSDVLRNLDAFVVPYCSVSLDPGYRMPTEAERDLIKQGVIDPRLLTGTRETPEASEADQDIQDTTKPPEQKRQKILARTMVRTYLEERHSVIVPNREGGKKIQSAQSILEKAKQLKLDGSLNYLTEKSLLQKAKAWQAAKDHPEEYPHGYKSDSVQPDDNAPRAGSYYDKKGRKRDYAKKRQYGQNSSEHGNMVRAYLEKHHGVKVPSAVGTNRYRYVPQILERAKELHPPLNYLTKKSVLEKAEAWQANPDGYKSDREQRGDENLMEREEDL